jgi:hypothetical protein
MNERKAEVLERIKRGCKNASGFFYENSGFVNGIIRTEYVLTTEIAKALTNPFYVYLEANPSLVFTEKNSAKSMRVNAKKKYQRQRIDLIAFSDAEGQYPQVIIEVKKQSNTLGVPLWADVRGICGVLSTLSASANHHTFGVCVFPVYVKCVRIPAVRTAVGSLSRGVICGASSDAGYAAKVWAAWAVFQFQGRSSSRRRAGCSAMRASTSASHA